MRVAPRPGGQSVPPPASVTMPPDGRLIPDHCAISGPAWVVVDLNLDGTTEMAT